MTEINIVLSTRVMETAFKHFVPSFVRPSNFDADVVKCFALVKCIVLCHGSQICGEMSAYLLANRKHLYEISGIICLRQKRD